MYHYSGSLHFINMVTEVNKTPSLMKYDLSTNKLDTLRTDTNYAYIKDQTLFYSKKYSEHSGFPVVGIIKMNLNTGLEEGDTPQYTGWAQTIDDSILHWNKNRGTQVTKDNKTWSKENYAEISSAVYHNENLFAVVDFSFPFEAYKNMHGIYELDVQQNTEKLLIQDVLQMNVTKDTFYYMKRDGIYKRKIDGGIEELVYNKSLEPSKSHLYCIAGEMYLYTDNGVILNLKTNKSNEIKDKLLTDDAMLNKVINAQKELTYIQTRTFTGNPKSMGRFSYGELLSPAYNTKKTLDTTLSTYFSKQFITEYMQSEYVKEIDGKMHYVIGDPSVQAITKFTKISSSELNEGKLRAKVETYNEYANVAKDVEIEFIYEKNQWVVNAMPLFELA
ncbi:IseA DL-endopeptidase inhibitor family protein [Bacillus cereus group sp. BfR-BA-01489]|uniref:IseA DL-endopeptidase inhibitor family protein n=1 Tax=Bacillus cereus group sp. BfR-BA-01489 TaxID=2920358 RepID=UPI001F5752BB